MRMKDLIFTYQGNTVPAVQCVSAELSPNSIVALLGPNGSGKTTLMKVLSGQLTNAQGTIFLGSEPANQDALLRDVFYVGNAADYADYQVREALAYLRLNPNWNEELFQQLLKRFSVNINFKRSFKYFSAGQTNLLLAIFALAVGAKVTLLDEIQAHLDVPTRYRLYETIIELSSGALMGDTQERIFVISSHMVEELEMLCSEVLILDNGMLTFVDSVDNLRAKFTSVQGNNSEIEKFKTNNPQLTVAYERNLGSYSEIIVDSPVNYLPNLGEFPSLTTHTLSFQDAFVAQLTKE